MPGYHPNCSPTFLPLRFGWQDSRVPLLQNCHPAPVWSPIRVNGLLNCAACDGLIKNVRVKKALGIKGRGKKKKKPQMSDYWLILISLPPQLVQLSEVLQQPTFQWCHQVMWQTNRRTKNTLMPLDCLCAGRFSSLKLSNFAFVISFIPLWWKTV